jgi:hypothetical protein
MSNIFEMVFLGYLLNMKRGYVRPNRRLTTAGQIARLVEAGVLEQLIYVEGREGETLTEAIKACREGDELCLVHAWVLAAPNKDKSRRPHREVIRRVGEADAKGVVIVEVATGRTTAGKDRDAIYADCVDWFAGRSTRRKKGVGEYRGGRPKKENTAEETAKAREIWKSRDFKTWRDCKPALAAVRYTLTQANQEFGPRE